MSEGEGQGGELVCADAPMSVRMHGHVRADIEAHPLGRISLSTRTRFFTVGADG
jgi:hypothetical protein